VTLKDIWQPQPKARLNKRVFDKLQVVMSMSQLESVFSERDPGDEALVKKLTEVMGKFQVNIDSVAQHLNINNIALTMWIQHKFNVYLCLAFGYVVDCCFVVGRQSSHSNQSLGMAVQN
jgi:hypothetical protein